jgi:ABC-type bacteriocin/lantibiotic exporter with double-glycine peptidase domain
LFEWVVPRAELGTLVAVIGGLALAALGVACFDLVKAIALVRMESRDGSRIAAADHAAPAFSPGWLFP